jgi:hypothetical protein
MRDLSALSGLRGDAVLVTAEPRDDVAQGAIRDVDRPAPRDGLDRRLVPVEDMRVDERCQQRLKLNFSGFARVCVQTMFDLKDVTAAYGVKTA